MTTKTFYVPITRDIIHKAATLAAAGIRDHAIALRCGISGHGVQHIKKQPGWADLVAIKEAALEALFRDDA